MSGVTDAFTCFEAAKKQRQLYKISVGNAKGKIIAGRKPMPQLGLAGFPKMHSLQIKSDRLQNPRFLDNVLSVFHTFAKYKHLFRYRFSIQQRRIY